jgi:hypothetical protein
LGALKSLGIHFQNVRFRNISLFKISVNNIDRSVHIDGSTVIVNPDLLTTTQRKAFQKYLRTDVLPVVGAIVDETAVPRIESVVRALPAVDEEASKFISIIPPTDVPLLKACLFLKKSFELGESIDGLKAQIIGVYGTRGRNLSNLCSAGYLETWFWPLYEQCLASYPSDPDLAKAQFRITYSLIVNEAPFTEFVAGPTPAATTLRHIVTKMEQNIANGVRFMNIHALGARNVAKVLKILPQIAKQTGAVCLRNENEGTRIFIRMEIPQKTLRA